MKQVATFPGVYGSKWIERQLDDCRYILMDEKALDFIIPSAHLHNCISRNSAYFPRFESAGVKNAFKSAISNLKREAQESLSDGDCFGMDFVIVASLSEEETIDRGKEVVTHRSDL